MDWVVLAAAVVGLGVASVATVRNGAGAMGSDISTSLSAATVVSLGELGDGNDSNPYYDAFIHAGMEFLLSVDDWDDAEMGMTRREALELAYAEWQALPDSALRDNITAHQAAVDEMAAAGQHTQLTNLYLSQITLWEQILESRQ